VNIATRNTVIRYSTIQLMIHTLPKVVPSLPNVCTAIHPVYFIKIYPQFFIDPTNTTHRQTDKPAPSHNLLLANIRNIMMVCKHIL